jgi:diaminopimelate decarboxylase
MHHFARKNGVLHAEDVALPDLAAAVGTPTYVYSKATLTRHWQVVNEAMSGAPHLLCYAVKACSNLAILQLFARMGSGFDIVSLGELRRVQAAGGDPGKVVFSGVGKRDDEIAAALQAGILCLNVESVEELARIEIVARSLGLRAPISVRVNPDVDPKTHKYIATGLSSSKFGVSMAQAPDLYRQAAASPHLRVVGIDCHIGSQILEVAPFAEAMDKVVALATLLRSSGISIQHLDIGGGLGISYRDESPAAPAALGAAAVAVANAAGLHLLAEPGRVIVGNAGILLTQVLGNKSNGDKHFAIVDAAMNDLLRPSLYEAFHHMEPVIERPERPTQVVDVVGPVCETGDFLAEDRPLPALHRDDLLAVFGAGAYGFSMSSNYNSRPRAAEVLVDGDQWQVIRQRESLTDLWAGESLLP